MSNSPEVGSPSHSFFLKTAMVLILLASIVASGCTGAVTQLGFESVSQGEASEYHKAEAALLVVPNSESWDSVWGSYFHGEKPAVNFEDYVVIVAFMGEKNTGGYRINIENLYQSGDEIKVIAKFEEPTGEQMVIQVLTEPYHIVKIRKTQLKQGSVTFRLVDTKGTEITREKVNI